jgi:large subunit ribosomal protein L6
MVGVGYKATVEENKLVLKIGYSHDVFYNIPENITINILKNNIIEIFGNDKIKVNQIAAEIRALKAPEPFKGKGIRYINEIINKKEGKKTNV